MKRIWMVGVISGMVAFGQQPAKAVPAKTAPSKKAAAKKAPAVEAVTIPKDAKELHSGTFRWVDPKGQAWLFTRTPFGVMKGPEPKDQQPDSVPADWTVKEEGDNLLFERPWPFGGVKRWTKSKSDLTEAERSVWQRQQQQPQAARQ